MSSTASFRLEQVAPERHLPPGPPAYLKSQIYSDPDVFRDIDFHAINEARTNYRSFKDLIFNLSIKKGFSDLEKVRAIFRWMTTKNMYTIMFDSELPGSPEATLGGFKDGKTTYARIFETLCEFSGVPCRTLSGWAKGVDYRPGYAITAGPINHSWNVVLLDGSWQLVDSHWATRYLQSERNTPDNLVYEYDDFYFLPEPTQLIYSHCPEDTAWQLLRPTCSRSQFEEYPLVKSYFFAVGMHFADHDQGVVHTRQGVVHVNLGFHNPTAFTFKVTYGEKQAEAMQGVQLKRYVIQETSERRVSFYFRAPRAGEYYLTVFAQKVDDRIRVENVFKAACEYKIVCNEAARDTRPYPQCSDSNWGAGAPVAQYGLLPSHTEAIVQAPGGVGEVAFRKSRDVRLYGRLTQSGEEELEDAVTVSEQDDMLYLSVRLPTPGEYGLEVYANEPDTDGDTFTHMCQYLVNYSASTAPPQGQSRSVAYVPTRQDQAPYEAPPPHPNAPPQGQRPYSGGGHQGQGGDQAYPKDPYQRTQLDQRMEAPSGDVRPVRVQVNGSSLHAAPPGHGPAAYQPQQHSPRDQPDYSQQQRQLSASMERLSATGGVKKVAPPVASKPRRQEDLPPPLPDSAPPDDFPPPPPESSQPAGRVAAKPVEVVYVSGRSPRADRRGQPGAAPGEMHHVGSGAAPEATPEQLPPPPPQSAPTDTWGRSRDIAMGPGPNVLRDARSQGQPQGHQVATPLKQGDVVFRQTEPETEYTPHPQRVYTSSITIRPPENFEAAPLQQAPPKPLPPSVPPKPFKDVSIFSNVDTHAVQVSKEEHSSFRDLVWHLIYARNITNELEKARAIFLWLCSKDLSNLSFNSRQQGTPEEILTSLAKSLTTYAVVFETLCSYASLHCKTISGYAKGAEYRPGMKFTGEQGQHSWNAVMVEGAWRLVDCHWAARRLVGKKVTADNVRYELDEYYFMPDPHQLIFTHFPEDPSWQLLERPIDITDFEHLVPVKSAFFKYGLQILSHREAVIRAATEVTVRISCPPFKAGSLAFTFTLSAGDGREEYRGVKLNRYGMQEMVDNVSFFTLRPPEPGSYRLIIYAKDLDVHSKEGVYGGVCEYELIWDGVSPQPFPPCVHTSWGPGDSATKYGLTPLQKGAIFSTVQGQAEVKFRLPRELRFTAKLKTVNRDEKALAGYVLHRVVADTAVFTLTAPEPGEYGLEIYANDPAKDGNSLFHAYQYLVLCMDAPSSASPLPVLPPGYLGPQPSFKHLGLSTLSHTDPYVQCDEGEILLQFGVSRPLRMTSQLIHVKGERADDLSDYILQQGQRDVTSFQVRLPRPGLYKLQFYALPHDDNSESLPGVFNYLLRAHTATADSNPFPKQYGQWKEGCYLHQPLQGHLTPNRPVPGTPNSYQYVYFKLSVPSANAVAVVVGEDWTQLEQVPGGDWQGEVFMEKHWGRQTKASVCANYGTVKATYSTLLEYRL